MKLIHADLGKKNGMTGHSIHRTEMQSATVTGKGNGDKGELFGVGDINTRFTRRRREEPSLPLFLQEKREASVPLLPSGPFLPNFFSNNPHFVSHAILSQ